MESNRHRLTDSKDRGMVENNPELPTQSRETTRSSKRGSQGAGAGCGAAA